MMSDMIRSDGCVNISNRYHASANGLIGMTEHAD